MTSLPRDLLMEAIFVAVMFGLFVVLTFATERRLQKRYDEQLSQIRREMRRELAEVRGELRAVRAEMQSGRSIGN